MIEKKLEFFLPFEFDQIPSKWDSWNDTWENSGKKFFIWNCFKRVPFDGLLISKVKFDLKKTRYKSDLKKNSNLKNLLKLPNNIKLFGDCGAFQYRFKSRPPFRTKDLLDFYQKYGFDMGCSIDHIIIDKKNKNLREKRYQITKNFAKECIQEFKSNNYTFELFGVAQGWDIESYLNMIKYLYELGYENLCIGGLVGVKAKSKNPKEFSLIRFIEQLNLLLKEYKFKKIHIFGRGNPYLLNLYLKYGITQFDYNIMRKSWTDEKKSYILFDKKAKTLKYYTSIRIPLIKNSMGKQNSEFLIFNKLKDFERGKISGNVFIAELDKYYQKYNNILNIKKKFKINKPLLQNLLTDEPWSSCECDLCKKFGVHVIVFRRRMRNVMRAFHNVYNYYLYLQEILNNGNKTIANLNLLNFT